MSKNLHASPSTPPTRRELVERLRKLDRANAPDHMKHDLLRELLEYTKREAIYGNGMPASVLYPYLDEYTQMNTATRIPTALVPRGGSRVVVPGYYIENSLAKRMAVRRYTYLRQERSWQVEVMRSPFYSTSTFLGY